MSNLEGFDQLDQLGFTKQASTRHMWSVATQCTCIWQNLLIGLSPLPTAARNVISRTGPHTGSKERPTLP